MSNKVITDLASITSPYSNDYLLIVHNASGIPTTNIITVNNFLNNANVNALYPASVKTANLIINFRTTPDTSSYTAQQGTIFHDNNYIYIAISNNNVKRAALSSF